LVFGRIEDFIDAFSVAIEHAKPGSSGAVDGVRDAPAFLLPPSFFGFEKSAVGKIWKLSLQKTERGTERVEGGHGFRF